jgi:pimeloyl-ACP methyl ester carboxylesterase
VLHAALLAPAAALALRAQAPSFPPLEALEGRTAGELVTRAGTYGSGPADWGYLLVPENRTREDARLLRLAVVRQHALDEARRTPLFNLVGGPGQSNVWGSGEIPRELLATRDVVRVGYRGIDSQDGLTCPEYVEALAVERPLDDESLARARAALRDCNERLRAEGIDLDGYNLVEVVADIEAARAALGYERIAFLAVSWGTQIAYAYAMRHPERVERMLLVGAGGRARGLDVWEPALIERKLARLAELWKRDPAAAARTPDIVATLRSVLASLPREWRGVTIEPGRVRLGAWYLLRNVEGAAQVLDAFAAAGQGDLAGLALLAWGYDEELRRQRGRRFGPYHGEFFSKALSSALDPGRDWLAPASGDTVLGSPAERFLWGAASRGGWPIRPIPAGERTDRPIDVPALVLMGELDFAAPHEYVERELMPKLERGRLVLLSEMGHTDVVSQQPAAFLRLARRFFDEGEVDASGYERRPIDFTPEPTLGAEARRLIPETD